jgi:hypothetical protein
LLGIVSFSCSNLDLANDDLNNDSALELAEKDFNLLPLTKNNVISGNSMKLRNGTQEINNNQTDESLIRGVSVRIPLFENEREPVVVKTGTWVTINFTFQGILVEGICPESLTEEEINSILEGAEEFIELNEFSLNFNSEEIDVLSNFKADNIRIVVNNVGNCQYILPFRYYLNPQAKGVYTLTSMLEGVENSRTISWVSGGK